MMRYGGVEIMTNDFHYKSATSGEKFAINDFNASWLLQLRLCDFGMHFCFDVGVKASVCVSLCGSYARWKVEERILISTAELLINQHLLILILHGKSKEFQEASRNNALSSLKRAKVAQSKIHVFSPGTQPVRCITILNFPLTHGILSFN